MRAGMGGCVSLRVDGPLNATRRSAVNFRLSDVGGNTHQLPSSCLKKNKARAPAGDDVSTRTQRGPPLPLRLNLVT
jgi:hypothetical protein